MLLFRINGKPDGREEAGGLLAASLVAPDSPLTAWRKNMIRLIV